MIYHGQSSPTLVNHDLPKSDKVWSDPKLPILSFKKTHSNLDIFYELKQVHKYNKLLQYNN